MIVSYMLCSLVGFLEYFFLVLVYVKEKKTEFECYFCFFVCLEGVKLDFVLFHLVNFFNISLLFFVFLS